MFRGVITGCTPDFKELVTWLINSKQNDDVLVVSDGRSEVARKQLRELFTAKLGDKFTELFIIYEMETTLHQDVRNPKRKLAFSNANVEILFVALPQKSDKCRQHLVPRDMFNKCGESTNFSRSYTGVPFRNLAEIPRLERDAKVQILGASAVGDFIKNRVQKEVAEKGHPLLWTEWKPVKLYSALLRDFQVATVVDMTPGSGAACLAALYSDIFYIGFGHNEAHRDWMKDILQRMFLAMVVNKDVAADPELVKNVAKYLQRSADAANLMLPKSGLAVGDSFTGANDSDAEEN